MAESNDEFWARLRASGVWFAFPDPPDDPEESSDLDFPEGVRETLDAMYREGYILDWCRYEVQCLIAAQGAFFRYPADSEQRALVLEAERYIRGNYHGKNTFGRCSMLPGETAYEARARSVSESRERFPYTVSNYRDWYREIYLYSEHWLRLRRDALSMSDDGACEDCGRRPKNIHVHHKEYRHIFDVTHEDLACLCPKCHRTRHESGVLA